MPKKKDNKIEEEIIKEENGATPITESGLPSDDQIEVLEGEVVSEEDVSDLDESLEDDSIPVEEKLELVKAALETSEAKAAEYLDGWQRAKAEFTNYRKRQERERELARFETVGRVAKRYLPVVDDMERALKERPSEGEGAAWSEGVELIYRKMVTALEADGVKPIAAEGEMFDPNQHEAVAQTESDEHESGTVIEVLQTGYKLGERVLRPAVVRVAA